MRFTKFSQSCFDSAFNGSPSMDLLQRTQRKVHLNGDYLIQPMCAIFHHAMAPPQRIQKLVRVDETGTRVLHVPPEIVAPNVVSVRVGWILNLAWQRGRGAAGRPRSNV